MVSPKNQDKKQSGIDINSMLENMAETRRFPLGIDLINQHKCPKGYTSPLSCMLCMEGHMLECHAGMTCEQAKCSHYLRDS